MKQKVVTALTEFEKQTVVQASLNLLLVLEKFESTNALISSVTKMLIQIFDQEPEHYYERHIDTPLHAYHDCVVYCSAYKVIGDCKYFADGSVTFGFCSTVTLPAWEPKDTTVVKMISEKTKYFRRQFENRFEQDEAITQATKEMEYKDKEFWKNFQQHKNCFMKYQLFKFLDKKFKTPKRFLMSNKTIWQFVDVLKQVQDQKKDISCLSVYTDKIYTVLAGLFQTANLQYLSVNYFDCVDKISVAYKNKTLYGFPSDNVPYMAGERLWSRLTFKVEQDPTATKIVGYPKERYIVDWVYTLQKLSSEDKLDSEFKEFLELLGIITEEDTNNE